MAENAATAQLDLALLLKGLQDHHDIQGDVILVAKVPEARMFFLWIGHFPREG